MGCLLYRGELVQIPDVAAVTLQEIIATCMFGRTPHFLRLVDPSWRLDSTLLVRGEQCICAASLGEFDAACNGTSGCRFSFASSC